MSAEWICNLWNSKFSGVQAGLIDTNDAVIARWKEECNNKAWKCATDSSAHKYLIKNKLINEG